MTAQPRADRADGGQGGRLTAGHADPPDERIFRRFAHAFGAVFLAFYLIPEEPPELRLAALVVGGLLFAGAVVVDAARLAGWFGDRHLYGLRSYEQNRPAAYVYWGAGALMLIVLAPEQVAIPCILCGALGDPMVGETRIFAGPRAGWAVAVAVGTVFFLLVAVPPLLALAAGVAFALGEGVKNPWLDDDFLTMAAPAALLAVLWLAGAYAPQDVVPSRPPLVWPAALGIAVPAGLGAGAASARAAIARKGPAATGPRPECDATCERT